MPSEKVRIRKVWVYSTQYTRYATVVCGMVCRNTHGKAAAGACGCVQQDWGQATSTAGASPPQKICVSRSWCRAARVGCKRGYLSTSAAKFYVLQVVGEVADRPKRFKHVAIPFDRLADGVHLIAWARHNHKIVVLCRLLQCLTELCHRDPAKLNLVRGVRWRTCMVDMECHIAMAKLCGISGPATH